ncbi:flavohemoprotein [Aspergillus bombycis]|uniref:Copper-containing nitrite reductase n=1 Tax=Aspergillus bombycis TaxID=109264 RepID=A0A1F7ZJE5_9EURO|nr:flavohemoprotein [Aspergillus bombycis]OGM39564.1 flavohemoprotein [Aspergillus bombycis]
MNTAFRSLYHVDLTTVSKLEQLTNQYKYEKWTFNNSVPGPFIRARVGDVVNLRITNHDESGMPHNIDCHAFVGPGGGSALTTVNEGETKTARFKLQNPGLFIYHCAVGPVGVHIANGMYGLMYVQPEHDLPAVDKEYYVMQSEFYHEPPEADDDGQISSTVEFSWPHALREAADVVVFNGSEEALTEKPLKATLDETVRIFFGNGGPNLTSSFHVIGTCFKNVYRDSDVLSPPAQCVQTVTVPPGGSTIVDMKMVVPGTHKLTPQQIQIVKSTIPALEAHGVAITTLFYQRLLQQHPELKNIFNTAHQATGEQPAALAHSVWAYATNIEHPEALKPAISRIGHKHASLGITADQYPAVGEGLLAAIKEVLGDAVDDQVLDAWRAAYGELAGYFIDFESELYRQAEATPGGWKGWRKFFISKKVNEGEEIISFYLTPIDKAALPALSDMPNGEYFQISVKRESALGPKPAGRISNVLHEGLPVGAELDVSMPFGDFVLDVNATTPVVLISGGVGLTPMMSMLKTIVDLGGSRRVVFIHAVRNGRVHAMKDRLAKIITENPQVHRAVFYEEVDQEDKQGVDYDFTGRADLHKIKDQAVLPDADYYICGPKLFMNAQSKSLKDLGVQEDRIHMEVFGSPAE